MPISALWWAVSRVACVRCSSCRTTPATATAPPSSQAITSQTGKAKLPTHIEVAAQCCGLPKDSVILLEQIRTLDKRRLRERMGKVDGTVMQRVDAAIAVSFGLSNSRLV